MEYKYLFILKGPLQIQFEERWIYNIMQLSSQVVPEQMWKKTFFCELWNFGNSDLAEKARKLRQI